MFLAQIDRVWGVRNVSVGTVTCNRSHVALWLLLGGHARSIEKNAASVSRFVHESAPMCSHTMIFSRPKLAEHTLGFGMPIRDSSNLGVDALEGALTSTHRQFNGHLSYVITKRSRPTFWAHIDSWFGGFLLLQHVLSSCRVEPKPDDVVLFSRPDVSYSAPIAIDAFRQHRSFVIYLPHVEGVFTKNDPSETFLLTSFDHWKHVVDACGGARMSCPAAPTCDTELMVGLQQQLNASVYYARHYGIRLVRMNGRKITIGSTRMHSAPVDLTARLTCTFPQRCPVSLSTRTSPHRGLMKQRICASERTLL